MSKLSTTEHSKARETLPDLAARAKIKENLDLNLLVEAGAGSGKTTSLVNRMVALIRTGTARVEQVAAVTFTRKAAAELREGFQNALEQALLAAREEGDEQIAARFNTAVEAIDRGFIGTIHSFCARLLRERPIEAGLDPSFREVFGPEELRLREEAWMRHLERIENEGHGSLAQLAAVGLGPKQLWSAYDFLTEHADLDFPARAVDAPGVQPHRSRLEELLDDAHPLMPRNEPENGWDDLQLKIRLLWFLRSRGNWKAPASFFEAVALLADRDLRIAQYRWGADPRRKQAARELQARFLKFIEPGAPAHRALWQWRAHRYPIVLKFAKEAADVYERERRGASQLNFNDLLMLAAKLLRESPTARRDLRDRYRCLLVDEFQDTDPIQAEVIFLLTATDADESDWRKTVPRPGSLFVVGDPKQSIFRFRRADIGIYNQVKARFRECGEVIDLTANFRSRPPIEEFVNGVFSELLPRRATEEQAAFAPLNAQKADVPHQGVYWYKVDAEGSGYAAVGVPDAGLIGSWIESRIDAGERTPGDFLVITAYKKQLAYYAAELERRNIPAQVTGAGIGVTEEVRELALLLRALANPDNPVLTLAVLVGLFFGLDHEQLAAHRLAGNKMSFIRPIAEPNSAVEEALASLNRWWQWTRRMPADSAIGAIVDELGLLPYGASRELGATNAGTLAFALEAVRRAGLVGDSSIEAAVRALQEALESEDAEAPLQPGRDDVVRIMNLHKAKGLEAPVVVLACPTGPPAFEPEQHVERPESGAPVGHRLISEQKPGESDPNADPLAAPSDWDELQNAERPFKEAEKTRLLYVAATRAQEELLISYCEKSQKRSPWRPLYKFLDPLGTELIIKPTDAPERRAPEATAELVTEEVRQVNERRRRLARPRYRVDTVTGLVKADGPGPAGASGRGPNWGNAVHQALEAAGRGSRGDRLRALCRTLLIDNELPLDEGGEPVDLEELASLVERVRDSETFQRAQEAERVLYEAPFAVSLSTGAERDTMPVQIVEGVIDLVFREADGWVIADYKTDVVDDPTMLEKRLERYRDQVDIYAVCWKGLTGESVKERRILLLGHDREVVW